ncbi:MAG: hypothetical protein FJ291_01140 [Planctomycetes bacterium]|nr:hypothetical protein [Planctomycetota bacterium]
MQDEKTKVTLLVRKSTVKRGKDYAARHRTTLSRMFEDDVERRTREEKPDPIHELRGTLVYRDRAGDPRFEYLKKRYE